METNPGPRRSVPAVYRILCSNVRGLPGNHSNLTVVSSQYDILLCSETLVSDMHHVSEIYGSRVRSPCLVVPGQDASGILHAYEIVTEHFANQNLSVVVAKCWFLGVWWRQIDLLPEVQ